MRVLLVAHGYPPAGVGGVERLSLQSAETLAARGHEVTVLTRRPSNSPPGLALTHEARQGISVVSVIGGGLPVEEFPTYEGAMEEVLVRTLAEVEPDVVLVTHLMHHSPGYVATAHRWGVPVVLELHDFFSLCPRAHLERRSGELCGGPEGGAACATHCFPEQDRSQLRWALRSQSFHAAVRDADAVLAPSQFVVDAFAELRGDNSPIEVVDNAVSELGPVLPGGRYPGGPLRIASIGVTIKHKGFQVVLEALRLASLPAVRYNIFGVALQPQAEELYRAAEQVPGLELRLFDGFVSTQLPVLLADAQLLIVPSLVAETYSIVAREAFACGLPVIASRIGALPDAIDPGENGWLFDPGDAAALAVLLRRIDADRGLLAAASAGARAEELTSVASRSDRIEAILKTAVAGSGHRTGGSEGAELRLMRNAIAAEDRQERDEQRRLSRRAAAVSRTA